ncbi:MTSS1 [Acanthosepion pharaonis]|uniref:MTSS1 n=1 Tax=Acanthosepion pharaonis TaxID=158019 RepID=A0A812EDL9_ACAPH|nr:MTSS1 [Sepia pharaonis]
MEEWKRNVAQMDKDHAKEYKKASQEIKKCAADTIRLQKKVKKGKSDIQSKLENALQDVNDKYLILEETEKNAVRTALIEERSRFCMFVTCFKPFVEWEISLLTEITHLKEVMDNLAKQSSDPHILPPAKNFPFFFFSFFFRFFSLFFSLFPLFFFSFPSLFFLFSLSFFLFSLSFFLFSLSFLSFSLSSSLFSLSFFSLSLFSLSLSSLSLPSLSLSSLSLFLSLSLLSFFSLSLFLSLFPLSLSSLFPLFLSLSSLSLSPLSLSLSSLSLSLSSLFLFFHIILQ